LVILIRRPSDVKSYSAFFNFNLIFYFMSTLFVKWYELVIVSDDVLDYVNIWQEYVHNSFNIFVENKKSLCYNLAFDSCKRKKVWEAAYTGRSRLNYF